MVKLKQAACLVVKQEYVILSLIYSRKLDLSIFDVEMVTLALKATTNDSLWWLLKDEMA